MKAAVDYAVESSNICSKSLTSLASFSNQATCGGSNSNIGYKITMQVFSPVAGDWDFDLNVDFGWGGVVYIDGEPSHEGYHSGDVWWAGNLNSAMTVDVIQTLSAGPHTIVAYGAEGCCDGTSNIRIKGPESTAFEYATAPSVKAVLHGALDLEWDLIISQADASNNLFPSSARSSYTYAAGGGDASRMMKVGEIDWESKAYSYGGSDEEGDGGWEKIAYQVDSSKNLFDKSSRSSYSHADDGKRMMRIGDMDWSDPAYKLGGKYFMKIIWDDGATVEWAQTSTPMDRTITGFESISEPGEAYAGTCSDFKGLGKSNSGRCIIDGTGKDRCWFNCIGLVKPWRGNIPGYNRRVASGYELYIATSKAYYFRMVYDDGETLEWKQTSKLTDAVITGYKAINVPAQTSSTCTEFKGLGLSQSGNCVFDGNGQTGCWWNCAGIVGTHNGNIPGFNSRIATGVKLYVARKPGTCANGHVKMDAYPTGQPYLHYNGKWNPICGHYFWDTDYGCSAVCASLGYSYSGTRTHSREVLTVPSIEVGKCNQNEGILGCTAAHNYYTESSWCNIGNGIGNKCTCTGSTISGDPTTCDAKPDGCWELTAIGEGCNSANKVGAGCGDVRITRPDGPDLLVQHSKQTTIAPYGRGIVVAEFADDGNNFGLARWTFVRYDAMSTLETVFKAIQPGRVIAMGTVDEPFNSWRKGKWGETMKNLFDNSGMTGMPTVPEYRGSLAAFGVKDCTGSVTARPESSRSYSTVWGGNAIGTGHAASTIDSSQAWSSQTNAVGQYMTIDLGEIKNVAGVAMQPRVGTNYQRVLTVKLETSTDGSSFTGDNTAYAANTVTQADSSVVNVLLNIPVSARYVRILPQTWSKHMSMRAEVLTVTHTNYGEKDCSGTRLSTPESSRSYSSIWSNNAIGTKHARSMIDSAQAWSSQTNRVGHYMTIDMGSTQDVAGVAMQPRVGSSNQRVLSVKLETSTDGSSFTGDSIVYKANTKGQAASTVVDVMLNTPVSARYVRILPQTWKKHMSMRADVLVCKGGTACPNWTRLNYKGRYDVRA